ncbi:MAG: serpin family protein [Myxococcota bacterium]
MRLAPSLLLITALAAACGAEDRTVVDPSPALQDIVDGHNAFAVDLYRQSIDEQEDLFISPFSVSAALGMTHAGASGETARQMEDALHIRTEGGDYHGEFGALIRDLDGDKKRGYTLNIANRVYGGQSAGWEPDFQQILSMDYGSPMQAVDFGSNASGIRREVNGWVASQTQNRIKDFLGKDQVTAQTSLILVNAIYFNGDWLYAFPKDLTRPTPFSAFDDVFDVPTINATAELPFAQVDGASVVELPYEGDEVSMVIVLPDAVDGLEELEAELTGAALDGWMDQLAVAGDVHLSLPRFEMASKVELGVALQELGMTDAFVPSVADFSGMTSSSIWLDGVTHQTFVSVDEEGTEAAAATAARFGIRSQALNHRIEVDHPFLFIIRDRLSGSVLFMGRVTDPR